MESTWQISIGKLITKTEVVLENGDKPKDETILLRSLSRLIPFEIFSFLGNSPRGWHDSLTNTYVVDKKIFEEHKRNFENFELIGLEEND